MGMNEVETSLIHYEAALESFQNTIRSCIAQIEDNHHNIEGMWKDSMRDTYDEQWDPLYEQLKDYRDRVSPMYIELILERLNFLRRYLYGN